LLAGDLRAALPPAGNRAGDIGLCRIFVHSLWKIRIVLAVLSEGLPHHDVFKRSLEQQRRHLTPMQHHAIKLLCARRNFMLPPAFNARDFILFVNKPED
jgi:hypothetical protein